MATDISDWHKYILPYTPGAPKLLMTRTLRETLRDFCRQTEAWQETLTAIDVVASTQSYALTSSNGDIAGVVWASYNDDAMDPTSEDQLDHESPEWRDGDEGTPDKYFVRNTRYIYLYPTPSSALTGGLDVIVALMPTDTATSVEDFLFDDFRDTIKHGALERLFDMRGQEWYDPIESERHGSKYRTGVSNGRNYAQSQYSRFTYSTGKTGFI